MLVWGLGSVGVVVVFCFFFGGGGQGVQTTVAKHALQTLMLMQYWITHCLLALASCLPCWTFKINTCTQMRPVVQNHHSKKYINYAENCKRE